MSPPVTLGKESGSMATTTTSPETDWRQEWFEFEDATYLNLAGQSPLPRVSVRAVEAALEAKKFPHHKTDATYFEVPDRIRECIAKLIGGKPAEIALTSGASAGVMAVAQGLNWQPGDERPQTRRRFSRLRRIQMAAQPFWYGIFLGQQQAPSFGPARPFLLDGGSRLGQFFGFEF